MSPLYPILCRPSREPNVTQNGGAGGVGRGSFVESGVVYEAKGRQGQVGIVFHDRGHEGADPLPEVAAPVTASQA